MRYSMTNKISTTDKTTAPSRHTLPADDAIKRLGTEIVTGLSRTEVEKRGCC